MKAQQKTAQLSARQAEAIDTATQREKAAHRGYASKFIFIGHNKEVVLPLLGAKRAREKWERAQAERLCIMRQFAAMLEAVSVDYYEPNTAKA